MKAAKKGSRRIVAIVAVMAAVIVIAIVARAAVVVVVRVAAVAFAAWVVAVPLRHLHQRRHQHQPLKHQLQKHRLRKPQPLKRHRQRVLKADQPARLCIAEAEIDFIPGCLQFGMI